MESKKKAIIATWGGGSFDCLNPSPDDVDIEDIAKSLSCICRYTGHVNGFYSVAQHSVLMSRVPEFDNNGTCLQRLLHDSAEAYIGDIHSPLKSHLCLIHNHGTLIQRTKAWRQPSVETKILKAIGEKFGVDIVGGLDAVKEADNRMMATEVRDLISEKGQKLFGPWLEGFPPLPHLIIQPWTWQESYREFLYTYNILKGLENEHKHKNEERVVA